MSHMEYTSKHVSLIYNVSTETIRNWAEEFERYLSPTANPGKGRHRNFTAEDMGVLSLIAQMKNDGSTFEDIHASLNAGSRGEPPTLKAAEIQAMVVSEQEKRLTLEVEYLQRILADLSEKAKDAEIIKEENIKLKAEVEHKNERMQELLAELKEARGQVQELSKQVGESYVRGVMETLERRGELARKESKE